MAKKMRMSSKMATCGTCFEPADLRGTSIIDGVRICHKCKAEKDKKARQKFAEGIKK